MSYKGVIYFDLDGTLLDRDSQLSEENRQVLHQLHQKGYLSVIASGRSPKEIREVTRNTPINSYVALNGQYVRAADQVLCANAIATDHIRELLDLSSSLGHPVASYGESDYRINFVNEATTKLYQLDNAPLPQVDPDFHLQQDIYMLYLFSEAAELDSSYEQAFQGKLSFFRDSPFSLAFVNHGVSKKTGIERMNDYLTLDSTQNTYAFGDGGNDIQMLQCVAHPIAMGNASDQVKAHAEFVTRSNTDGGIAHALKHYGIL